MDIQSAIQEALLVGEKVAPQGKVASYIPELAKADPAALGIAIYTQEGQLYSGGQVDEVFTFQSAAKVFILAKVLKDRGMSLFEQVSYEPSGNPFHSIVHLMNEKGIPRNPYINSGAILTCSLLPGRSSAEKIEAFQGFLREVCGGSAFPIDEAVYHSEALTGHRNRGIAQFLKQYQKIDDVDVAVDTYFQACSILLNLSELAHLGLFLTHAGIDPITGHRIVSDRSCRTVVSLMTTCGMYDEAGRAAIYVGLPCKSAVSGTILAIVPHKMSIAVFSPPLGEKGNSVAGLKMLETLSDRLDLSIYG